MRWWWLALVGAGCAPEQNVVRRSHEDVFYQVPTDMVDILWVVDDSFSMADEQAEVATRFESFISSLEETNLDWHVGVVTTDMDDPDRRGQLVGDPAWLSAGDPDYVDDFRERVQVGTEGSDREKGIDAALQALTEPIVSGANAGFLRSGATLSVIYVSDENDCTDDGALSTYVAGNPCYDHSDELVSVRQLIEAYGGIKTGGERLLVSAIVGPELVDNCDGAVPGFRYEAMARAFGGLEASICEADFSGIMETLGLQVSGEMDSFNLTYAAVEDTIEVWVDDVEVLADPDEGWSYDAEYWVLHFHGDAVPPRDSTIRVSYEISADQTRAGDE